MLTRTPRNPFSANAFLVNVRFVRTLPSTPPVAWRSRAASWRIGVEALAVAVLGDLLLLMVEKGFPC
jgi:hypothetical protein